MARILLWTAIGLVVLAGAGAIGWAIGNSNSSDQIVHTGVALETSTRGTARAGGMSYLLPVNVTWIDRAGTVHDGPGPPPCLPRGQARRVRFATVSYSVAGTTQGIVVWVHC